MLKRRFLMQSRFCFGVGCGPSAKVLAIFVVALGLTTGPTAHAGEEAIILVELSFQSAIPRGEYSIEIDDPAFGLDFIVGARLGESPIYLGLEFGWYRFGVGHRRGDSSLSNEVISDNTFSGHVLMRYQPRWGRFRPYGEGMVGLRYLLATRNHGGSITFEQSEAVASWGLGAGLDVLLSSERLFDREGGAGYGLTLGVRYLWGTEADFRLVDESSGTAVFSSHRSTTNALMPHIGLSAHF